jgi:hypothetical protein
MMTMKLVDFDANPHETNNNPSRDPYININNTREPLEITGVNESTSLEMTPIIHTPPEHLNGTIAMLNCNTTGVEEESQQGNQTASTDTSHMNRHQMQLRPHHGQTKPTHLLGQGFEDEIYVSHCPNVCQKRTEDVWTNGC